VAILRSVNALAPVAAGVGAAPFGAGVDGAGVVGDPGRLAAAIKDGPTLAVVIELPHAARTIATPQSTLTNGVIVVRVLARTLVGPWVTALYRLPTLPSKVC
jgi:hypothetical protein